MYNNATYSFDSPRIVHFRKTSVRLHPLSAKSFLSKTDGQPSKSHYLFNVSHNIGQKYGGFIDRWPRNKMKSLGSVPRSGRQIEFLLSTK
jgi:hypothetical protein